MMTLANFNAAAGERHGIAPADLGVRDWSDLAGIRAWQDEHQLEADGWFGDASARAFRLAQALDRAGIAVDRRTWRATHTFRRPALPRSIVQHDEITRSIDITYKVLENHAVKDPATGARNLQPLALCYIIPEQPGPTAQCHDPGTRYGWHAGAFNQEAIGVGCVGMYDPRLLRPDLIESDRERLTRVTAAAWSPCGRVVDYTPWQARTMVALADVLADVYDIPRVAPGRLVGQGKVAGIHDATYRGAVAHGQFSSTRWDGLLAVDYLLRSGWGPWAANGE